MAMVLIGRTQTCLEPPRGRQGGLPSCPTACGCSQPVSTFRPITECNEDCQGVLEDEHRFEVFEIEEDEAKTEVWVFERRHRGRFLRHVWPPMADRLMSAVDASDSHLLLL